MKIFLVDDSEFILLHLCSILQAVGHETTVAYSGESAMNRLKRVRPDLIITDFNMPGLDGFTLLRQLQSEPGLGDVPVIILTAKALNASAREMVEMEPNVSKIFAKPVDESILLAAINEIYPPRPED